MKKFTFKKYVPTGRWASFELDSAEIKLNKVVVGSISESKDGGYSIGFMVVKDDIMEDGNPNCKWKWVWLKYKGKNYNDAKSYVTCFNDEIQKKFNLYIEKP